MGALHDALQTATPEQRHALVRDAIVALKPKTRSVTRDGYTLAVIGTPAVGMNGLLQLTCRITRVSDGAVVTPRDLNPVFVRFPPYLVPNPTGDVTIGGVVYSEDLEAAILSIVGPLIDKVR